MMSTSTQSDRWLLCEEWAFLTQDVPSSLFLSYRLLYTTDPTYADIMTWNNIPRRLIPGDPSENWDNSAMANLRELRALYPERTLRARKAAETKVQNDKVKGCQTLAEMEGYVALSGESRILFMHRYAASQDKKLFTPGLWTNKSKPKLLELRRRAREVKREETKPSEPVLDKSEKGQQSVMQLFSAACSEPLSSGPRDPAISGVDEVSSALPTPSDEKEWLRWLVDPFA
jgi:hypothetical protein